MKLQQQVLMTPLQDADGMLMLSFMPPRRVGWVGASLSHSVTELKPQRLELQVPSVDEWFKRSNSVLYAIVSMLAARAKLSTFAAHLLLPPGPISGQSVCDQGQERLRNYFAF